MTKYRHTLVYKLDGINMNRIDGKVEVIEDSATGLVAVVMSDPDDYCLESDRWTALANLRLNALFGQPGLEITQERITEQLEKIRESRKLTFGTGPYLVLMRDAEVEDFSPEFEDETPDYIVCSGGPPRGTLREASSPQVLATQAAITIATEDLNGIKKVSDTIVFFRSDGKPIYCYTMSGTANADVIRAISVDTLDSVGDWYRTIAGDLKPVERVVRLLTSSLQTEGDALRAFLHAWTALEILINKTFKRYETQFFSELSEGDQPEARLQYLERMRSVMGDKYRMIDKFALIASQLSPADADEDVKRFKQAKKERDNLAHGQDVAEANLPVSMVQSLVRKYIRLHLDG